MNLFTLNIHGKLKDYTHPAVMGIINITPDSLYSESKSLNGDDIRRCVNRLIDEGADFIDIGAYSTRPGCAEVTEDEELRRLEMGISIIRSISAEIPVSVDTFRSGVARRAVKEMSADIINDISGGNMDKGMFETVAELRVPYVLTHSKGDISTLHSDCDYGDLLADILRDLATKVTRLQLAGVNDIIIDPGFGFSKSLEQNWQLFNNIDIFHSLHKPILIGVSRKSMITKALGINTEDALNGTTVLNTIALMRGASILRVHDVKAAKEAITLVDLSQNS